MTELSKYLVEARKTSKLSAEDVSRITRIPLKTVIALETARLEDLPAPAILRGFVIAYCRTVRCDENHALEMLAELTRGRKEPLRPMPNLGMLLAGERRSPLITRTYLAIVMVFVIGIIIAMIAIGTHGTNADMTRSGGIGLRDVPEVVDR